VFKNLEKQEITAFNDEIRRLNRVDDTKIEKSTYIKQMKSKYSDFALRILKDALLESSNYQVVI